MESIVYNLGHNILKLYNVLVQIRLTTSKTERGIHYRKFGIRVVSRAANDLRLRILGNKEILRKYQIWVEPLFQKLNFGNSSQKTRKSRYQTFLNLSSFTGFLWISMLPSWVMVLKLSKKVHFL